MTLYRGKYRVESTRLRGWDYSTAGAYFVTICTRRGETFFGAVTDGETRLSPVGKIAHRYWADIPNHFPHVTVDEWVVMPTHIHGILLIHAGPPTDGVETRHVASLRGGQTEFGPLKPGSLSRIVQAYKAAVTRWCRRNANPAFAWQPRFYEHIIRNDRSLDRVRRYIRDNPALWEMEREHPEGLYM
jgi:putative transposase